MTKLEEKLIDLGYEYESMTYYSKIFGDHKIYIDLFCKRKIEDYFLQSHILNFRKQEQINNLQQAFNEMQKDLEVLKKYE